MKANKLRKRMWQGSSQKDFEKFPEQVKLDITLALEKAQKGEKDEHAKPLKGFPGASVLEIVENDRSGTYRLVYTTKFESAVYVLHAFKKKSHHGIATPKEEIELIKRRFKGAAEVDAEILAQEKKGKRK